MSNRFDCGKIRAALTAVAFALGTIAASSAIAAPAGPVYPAPGGNSWSGSGGPLGTAVVEYSYGAFNSSAYSNLYWGPSSNSAVSIVMDGTADNKKFGSLTPATEMLSLSLTCGPGCAQGTGDTWLSSALYGPVHVSTMFTLTLRDSSNAPISFVTDSSLGLATSGVIADVTTAANAGGFKADMSSQARLYGTNNTWQPSNVFFNGYNAGCCVQSNFNGGFFSTAPIPEPESYAMMLAGLGLMGFIARRRKQKQAAA